MTLQGAIEGALPLLRKEARARMVDTFEIKVSTGAKVYDRALKKEVEQFNTLFTTPGFIGVNKNAAQRSEVGGRTSVTVGREVCIPWDSDAVPTDAVVVCTAIGAQTPPRMLGRTYRVQAPEDATQRPFYGLAIIEELS